MEFKEFSRSFPGPFLIFSSLLMQVVKMQKKVLRIISNSQRLEHTRHLFLKFQILRLEEIHFYKIAQIMFKVHHNAATRTMPLVFCDLFSRNSDIHEHGTRQRNHLHVPFARTNNMSKAITVKGVCIWNIVLQKNINIECSLLSFKISLKKFLLNYPSIVTYSC